MRARIEQVDEHHDAFVYEANMADLKAVAEYCKARQNAGLTGSKDVRALAEIPDFIIQQYCDTNGVTWAEFMRNPEHATRMLNDPALSAFRIHRGRV
jgi:hypothetical protein